MNKFSICMCCIGFAFYSQAQQNSVATGGDASGSGGSASYSVGQIDYSNAAGSNGSSNEGVQQPYEFYQLVGLQDADGYITSIYPNPTQDQLMLTVEDLRKDMHYQLYDLNGKLVRNNVINDHLTTINVRDLSAGEYHLNIFEKTTTLQSIKIIKH